MTAAERQRRRRERLRGEGPPKKRGRPNFGFLKNHNELLVKMKASMGVKRESALRDEAARTYQSFGKQVLGIHPKFPETYSHENAERYRPLDRKLGILEQLGRQAVFNLEMGMSPEEAAADVRELADELLDTSVKATVAYLQWERKDARDYALGRGDWAEEKATAATSESEG
jgi:hypothetical protein